MSQHSHKEPNNPTTKPKGKKKTLLTMAKASACGVLSGKKTRKDLSISTGAAYKWCKHIILIRHTERHMTTSDCYWPVVSTGQCSTKCYGNNINIQACDADKHCHVFLWARSCFSSLMKRLASLGILFSKRWMAIQFTHAVHHNAGPPVKLALNILDHHGNISRSFQQGCSTNTKVWGQ